MCSAVLTLDKVHAVIRTFMNFRTTVSRSKSMGLSIGRMRPTVATTSSQSTRKSQAPVLAEQSFELTSHIIRGVTDVGIEEPDLLMDTSVLSEGAGGESCWAQIASVFIRVSVCQCLSYIR